MIRLGIPEAGQARGPSVRALIDAMAQSRAGATFLLNPETGCGYTFAELRRRCVRVARHLTLLGQRPGSKVATVLRNGLPAAELMLGAMYGGCVPVPLNPDAGQTHLAFALRHCDAEVVFVGSEDHDAIAGMLEQIDRHVFVAAAEDTLGADSTRDEVEEAAPPLEPSDVGLLIYTSGSTGAPKCAMFTHAQLVACARNTAAMHQLTAADRFYCVLPLYHMNSIDKLLGVLISGGSIVMPRRFNVATFWKHLRDYRCTWGAVVPTIVSQLLRWGDPPGSLAHVRFVRCSSAPLSPAEHQAFEERFGLVVVQGLGMTEAGGIFLNPLPPKPRKPGSLGVPYGFDVKIVDADGRAVAPPEIGEILVRGPSVMKGYYKNAAATAQVIDGDGWLRTGDRGYEDEEGYFFSAGRSKEVIIKAGTNIAPQEIDHVLAAHPAVLEAAAVGVPDPYLGEEIVAHVVPKPGLQVTQQELRDFCAGRLGEFKTPARIHFVDDLPKGPAGKVQRLRLNDVSNDEALPFAPPGSKTMPRSGAGSADADVSPRTPFERVLAGLWQEALDLDAVSIHANFFALGGYSLLALEILARLRRRFSVEAPLRLFFEAPTIAEQAACLAPQFVAEEPTVAARSHGGGAMSVAERTAIERAWLERARAARPTPAPTQQAAATLLLAPVRRGDVRPSVFCIYGAARYLALAKHLGPEQPAYGLLLQREIDFIAASQEEEQPPDLPSIEELATLYVEGIRGVQPSGPYRLVGHSFGGRIALEIAQQLRRRGEQVALLAVLDTYMPGAFTWSPLRWLTHHLRQSLRLGPAYAMRHARRRLALLSAREEQFRATLRRRYVPQRYPGSVVLFRAAEGRRWPGYDFDPTLGWTRLAGGGLIIHDVPGNHEGMLLEPNVQVLARELGRKLAVL